MAEDGLVAQKVAVDDPALADCKTLWLKMGDAFLDIEPNNRRHSGFEVPLVLAGVIEHIFR